MGDLSANATSKTIAPHIGVSVVVPAYNERARLPGFLRQLRHYLDRAYPADYEVLVVDDGSRDGMGDVLRKVQQDWHRLRVVVHRDNQGKGAALRTGVLATTGTLVLLCDADGAAALEDERLLRGAVEQGADIAVGSRHGGASVQRRPLRRAAGGTFAACVHRLFGLPLRDTQCGFKLLRRGVAQSLFERTVERGYLIDVELLLLAQRAGYTMAEVPVAWREMPGSKLSLWRAAPRMAAGLWRLYRRAGRVDDQHPRAAGGPPLAGPHRKELAGQRRQAVTLVELLVVIAIIGLLGLLLLPALSAVREMARRSQCQNHLRQMAVAVHNHQSHHGHYPTGGWTYTWIGDAERGFGIAQPGGWIYNVLPYMEEQALWESGRQRSQVQKRVALARLSQTPLAVFRCPSRGGPRLTSYKANLPARNAQPVPVVATSDYAINAGDREFGGLGPGPETLDQADRGEFRWRSNRPATGLSFQRSLVRPAQVLDGTSKTYLVGEKYIAMSGRDLGHNQSMYTGYDYDTFRWTETGLAPQGRGNARSFGSPHSAGAYFAFADGSVRMIRFGILLRIHRALGNRHDGEPLGEDLD